MLGARALLTGWRPGTGAEQADDVLDEHRLLTSSRSPRDRFQVPWPRAFGTPPWAVANALRALTGKHIATVFARPRPAIAYEVIREQLRDRPVPVYIGSAWLPRHVVLAVRPVDDPDFPSHEGIEVFDPARGRLVEVRRQRWVENDLDIAGWSHVWFVI